MQTSTVLSDLSDETRRYLRWTPLAVLPCLGVATWRFGLQVLLMLAVAFIVGALIEFASDLLRHRRSPKGFWLSAPLFVLVLPVGVPLWMVAVGFAFALIIAQEIFGGVGCERFSAPLLGRLFLMLSYPAGMTGSWVVSFVETNGTLNVPALSALFAGGVLVLFMRAIGWRTLFVAAGLAVAALGLPAYDDATQWNVMFGAIFFAVFFLVPNPSISPKGHAQFIYGSFIVVVAALLQAFGGGLEGVTVAVLAANALAPMMTRQPTPIAEGADVATTEG